MISVVDNVISEATGGNTYGSDGDSGGTAGGVMSNC